ncbi:MAG: hypothetical protein C4523_20080 [Myxococcales bacterium]|nr:MAG: hypothetical protein C4523_20080 [Myxococcales bacterium]
MIEWLVGAEAAAAYNRWEVTFRHVPGLWETNLVVLLVAALLVLFVLNQRRLKSTGWRVFLYALRLLFLAGLVLLWLQPAIQLQKVLQQKRHLIVLVDRSRSMTLPAGDNLTRAEQARRFFADNAPWFADAAARFHLQPFVFDGQIKSAPFSRLIEQAAPEGTHTALGGALVAATEERREGEVAGAIVVADGRENPPEPPPPSIDEAAKLLARRGVPVWAFGAGKAGGIRDLAIRDVRYDGFAFVHTKMAVEAEIASRGYGEMTVVATLSKEGQVVATAEAQVMPDSTAPVEFVFTPDRVGRYVYTVEVPPPPDDAMPQNNRKSFIIDVLRDKIRVLHVCGHPDYDEMFLRRLMKNNPNVDLISFFILRTNTDLQLVPEDELSLIPFPTEELFSSQLHTFDMVIFQNFTYLGYQMDQYLPNIRRYVQQGGAFVVTGGDVSYGAGGYDGTAIEDVLPFEIVPADPKADAEPFVLKVTEAGRRHPIMQVRPGEEASDALWEKAPPLFGLNLGLSPRPDALVLAEHPKHQIQGRPAPVVAARLYGEGRVLALSVDSTWAWHFLDAGQGGEGELYRAFWNNAIRWLIRDPELRHLSLRADHDTVAPSGEIRLDIRLTDRNFQPRGDAPIAIEIVPDGGASPVAELTATTDAQGQALATFKAPATEGLIRIKARATGTGGEADEEEELLLFIQSDSGELADVDVDFDALRRLAKTTGGEFHALPYKLSQDLPIGAATTDIVGQKRDVPIWDNSFVLGLLAGLIVLEWWLRKRKRLN